MNTARIFKEEIDNPAIWDTIIRDLELPKDTDEITVKAVCYDSVSKRKESRKKSKKESVTKVEQTNLDPTIQIVISGGAVQSIDKPQGIALEIRDYDIDGADEFPEDRPDCKQDEDGDWYQRMFWDKNESKG